MVCFAEAEVWTAIEAIGTWALGCLTLVLATVAVFPKHIHRLCYKPNGQILYDTGHFFLQNMQPNAFPPLYSLRLLVINSGNELATTVQCSLTDIRVIRNGREERWSHFIPIRLWWTHLKTPVLDYLPEESSRLLDLGSLTGLIGEQAMGNVPVIALTTELGGNHQFAMLMPDSYVLELAITAREGTLFRGCLHLTFQSQWTVAGTSSPAGLTLTAGNIYCGELSRR
jgi:hypothetical protein